MNLYIKYITFARKYYPEQVFVVSGNTGYVCEKVLPERSCETRLGNTRY